LALSVTKYFVLYAGKTFEVEKVGLTKAKPSNSPTISRD